MRQFYCALESRLYIRVNAPLAIGVDSARDVEADEAVHHRCPCADARHREANLAPVASVAGPTEIREHNRTHYTNAVSNLCAREPERVAMFGAGPLATH